MIAGISNDPDRKKLPVGTKVLVPAVVTQDGGHWILVEVQTDSAGHRVQQFPTGRVVLDKRAGRTFAEDEAIDKETFDQMVSRSAGEALLKVGQGEKWRSIIYDVAMNVLRWTEARDARRLAG